MNPGIGRLVGPLNVAFVARLGLVLFVSTLLAGALALNPTTAKPAHAAWCGLTSWNLEYDVINSWHVNAQGYDQNGNFQSIWLYLPSYVNRDSNHCWVQNQTMHFYWYGYQWQYFGASTKYLVPVCYSFAGLPLACYQQWSAPSKVSGP